MTDRKSIFKELCEQDDRIPLFYTYGWFQALYGNEWEVIIELQGGKIIAFMPLVTRKKKGFKMLLPETLIPYQGIWIVYPQDLTTTAQLKLEKRATTNIIKQLPKLDYFEQQFHPSVTNWLPFYWEGYTQTTRYTYTIPYLNDLESVYNGFKSATKSQIKQAGAILRTESSTDVKGFHELKTKICEKKKINYLTSLERLQKIMDYSFSQNAGEILVALNQDNQVHAMLIYIWDNQSAYYLHSVSEENSAPGAMSLLIWEAIQRASKTSTSFDFEGSMIQSIESYFRSFGGQLTPYFQITKTNSKSLEYLKLLKG